jgi:predicted TIM-barrel fold metal-dependent hydrolase
VREGEGSVNPSLNVVDAHVHLGPPKYAAVDEYLATMGAEQISGAILVQHMGNSDNGYLGKVRAAHPKLFGALAIVEAVEDAAAVLDAGFAGLRLSPRGLAGADGCQVFDVLSQHKATVSVTGPLTEVISEEFLATVRSHPHVGFRIEHLGGFRYGTGIPDRDDFRRLLRLSGESNVTLMWSGFFLNAGSGYPYPNTHGYLTETLEAFASERIMWSGDWNRAGLAAGEYRRAIELVGAVVPDPDQQADILGRTAQRFFGLSPNIRGDGEHVGV